MVLELPNLANLAFLRSHSGVIAHLFKYWRACFQVKASYYCTHVSAVLNMTKLFPSHLLFKIMYSMVRRFTNISFMGPLLLTQFI